jgi:hypothetical protein
MKSRLATSMRFQRCACISASLLGFLKTFVFFLSNRKLQPLEDPCVTRVAERAQKPSGFLLMPSFAASFFCNIRHITKIWRKRVGVEIAE